MSWQTVPVCDQCWEELNGFRLPHRLRDPERETCFKCHEVTNSGIFSRENV